jgi:signal transduction histidine kinase
MSQHSAVTRPSVSALSSYRAESEKDFIECRSRPIAARSNYHLPSLGERNEAKVKDEILAIVAHELRGPLAPLRLAAEVIRKASPGRTDVLRMVDTIERQIEGIARLAEDLMDATRIGQGSLRLCKGEVDLIDCLSDPLAAAAAATAARCQAFTVQIPDGPLSIGGDSVRLSQAVSNLLQNAVKYTPPGGHIRFSAYTERGELVLCVSDDGLGISAVLLPHVFDLFAQSSRTVAASSGGLGIGLAVVSAIVHAHGGTVSASSAGPGAGSTFTLRLPVLSAQHASGHI